MTVYAVSAGFFSAGFALVVLLLYATATARRCVPWRLGVHVVIVAATQVSLTVLATVTLSSVPEVLERQPWRPGVQAVTFTLLTVSLVLVVVHVRDRVTAACPRGHDDWFHRAAERAAPDPPRA